MNKGKRHCAIAAIAVLIFAAAYFGPRLVERRGEVPPAVQSTTSYSPWPTAQDPQVIADGDQWESEALHERINSQLGKLKSLVQATPLPNASAFATIQSDDFRCGRLSPNDLKSLFEDALIRVRRSNSTLQSSDKGFSGIRAAMQDLLQTAELARSSTQQRTVHFKVVDIQLSASEAVSRILVELVSHSPHHRNSMTATWECRWRMIDRGLPKLSGIKVLVYEDVELKSSDDLLVDVTKSVLDTTEVNEQHWLRGIDHWCHRLTHIDDMRMHGHHGIAIADVNGDGLEDLYVCDAGGLPNRLYLQKSDGTTIDHSQASNINWLESTAAALFVDFDNDGDQDLAATTVGGLILASNDGKGRFKPVAAHSGMREAHSISGADYDNDGDVDLYVCVYGNSNSSGGRVGFEASVPIPYSDANNGGVNVLLRNDGNLRFVDVTKACGLDQNNHRWSFSSAWQDFDRDGDPDLYVANDFGRNNLYENEGGRFRDVAGPMAVEDRAGGMSAAWADFNRDSRPDLYIGNMYSAAGNRVTYQRRFLDDRTASVAADLQRMARGNTLFVGTADGRFRDASLRSGTSMGRWSWGSQPVDLNNDGYDDLVIANGYFTNQRPDDL